MVRKIELGSWVAELHDTVADCLEDGSKNVPLLELCIRLDPTKPLPANYHIVDISKIARLSWRPDTGEVVHLYVAAEYRRQGLATLMWDEARRLDSSVQHSQYRTKAGDAWASRIADRDGETLPPLTLV